METPITQMRVASIHVTLPLFHWLRIQAVLAATSLRYVDDAEVSPSLDLTLHEFNRALWIARGGSAEEFYERTSYDSPTTNPNPNQV